MSLQLEVFDNTQAEIIRPWFNDELTKKWLGDKSWVNNITRLQNEPAGTEFRGSKRIAYYAFVAYYDDKAVGFIDGGISNRWVKYGGEKDGKPIYLDTVDKPTSGISFVVDPAVRGHGYATAMLKALTERPEYNTVKIFEAGVDPRNTGSIKALEAAGFTSDYQPDFEGIIYFFLNR